MSRSFIRLSRLLPAALVLAACSDRHSATIPVDPGAGAPAPAVAALRCSVAVRAGTLACAPLDPSAGGARALVVGGQDQYVKLASSGVTSNGATMSASVTLQNLMPQALGTTDGTSGAPIRVFFESAIVAYGGGAVSVANPDGEDTFTAGDQPFFEYAGPLHPQAVSAAKPWTFSITAPVDSFKFTVLVSAPVEHEGGWVALTPPTPSVQQGDSLRMAASVRGLAGQELAGQAVAWSTSDPAVATVSSQGVVRGVAGGTATITATSGDRAGSTVVTVTVGGGDVTPPALTGFSLSPARVDASAGTRTVEFLVRAFDRASGVESVGVAIGHPGQTQRSCSINSVTGPVSGTAQDGVWRCVVTLPQGAAVGTWDVQWVSMMDVAGNFTRIEQPELRKAGLPYTLEVIGGGQDLSGPRLTGFTFSPRVLDLTADSALVEFRISTDDVGTGVQNVGVAIGHPQQTQKSCGAYDTPAEGTEASGVWICRIRFSRWAAAGTWTVQWVSLTDRAGNFVRVMDTELQAAGYPLTLQVTNPNGDVTAPELTGFSFTPQAVNTASGDQLVTFTFQATDAQSGIRSASVAIGHPGQVQRSCETSDMPVAGTSANGTFRCTILFPQGSASGAWTVQWVGVRDNNENFRRVWDYELTAAGYPTVVTVTN